MTDESRGGLNDGSRGALTDGSRGGTAVGGGSLDWERRSVLRARLSSRFRNSRSLSATDSSRRIFTGGEALLFTGCLGATCAVLAGAGAGCFDLFQTIPRAPS